MIRTLKESRKLITWISSSALVVLVSIAVAGIAIYRATNDQQRTNQQICRAFNRFDAAISTTLQRSKANLPKLAYFRTHPLELARQEAEVQTQVRQFRQHTC